MVAGPDVLAHYRRNAEICKVLTDPKRLLLLASLRAGDRTVGELAATVGTSLPNTSQHLAVLRSAGLVDGRREGSSVRYHLAEPAILDACDIVGGIVERRLAGRRFPARGAAAVSRPSPAPRPSVTAG
jgi:DNA-binding transcriptional ArsR family regulator